jgi:hypothetical protein
MDDLSLELRVRRASEAYERGMFFGEYEAVGEALRDLDGVSSAAAELARGRLLHALAIRDRQEHPAEREAFAAALTAFRALGDAEGEAESLFLAGALHPGLRC